MGCRAGGTNRLYLPQGGRSPLAARSAASLGCSCLPKGMRPYAIPDHSSDSIPTLSLYVPPSLSPYLFLFSLCLTPFVSPTSLPLKHTQMHTRRHTHTPTLTHSHTKTHTSMHTSTHTHTDTQTHTHTHTHTTTTKC